MKWRGSWIGSTPFSGGCARRRRHAGGEDSAHGRGVLVHAQLSRHVALSCTITTALARAARAGPLHGSAHLATQAEPVASRGSARPPGAHPRQSNHHHTVTPSHRLSNPISHFGDRGLRPTGWSRRLLETTRECCACSIIPGAHPRQSNHHHTVTPSHRLSNLISHFGGHELRPSRPTVTLPIYNNFTFSIVVKDGVTV